MGVKRVNIKDLHQIYKSEAEKSPKSATASTAPPVKKKGRRPRFIEPKAVTFYIEADEWKAFKDKCRTEGVTASQKLRELLSSYLSE